MIENLKNEIEFLLRIGGNNQQIARIIASDWLRKMGADERETAIEFIKNNFFDVFEAIRNSYPERMCS